MASKYNQESQTDGHPRNRTPTLLSRSTLSSPSDGALLWGGHPKVPPLDDYTERGLPLQSQPQDVGFDVPNYAHALKTWTAYKILTPSPPPSSSFILPSILLCPLLSFPWQIQTSLPRFPL